MKLKSLNFQRWSADAVMNGSVEFFNDKGEVKLNLSEAQQSKVLAAVADALVESVKEVAADLTANIVADAGNLLEHKL